MNGSGAVVSMDELLANMAMANCSALSLDCDCNNHYQFYESDERLLLGIVALPLILFGLCANLTSILIFTNRAMAQSPINWYLTVLSCSDTIILLSAFFVLTLPRLGEVMTMWTAVRTSYWVSPYMYGLMTLAQTVSVWMTTGMSVHRFVGVCFPFQAGEILSRKRVVGLIAMLITFSVFFNSTRFFEVRVANDCYRLNIAEMIPVISPTALRLSDTYRLFFFGWAYTILMFIVPFTILIIVNTTVLMAVRRQSRMHSMGEADEARRRAERKEFKTTVMLVAIVVVFLACNTLAFVVNILENIGYEDALYGTLVMYNNLLVLVNASCNIGIYLLFSDKYRILLKYYLCCQWSRKGEILLSSLENYA